MSTAVTQVAKYAGWASVVFTIAGLIFTIGAKTAAQTFTVEEIKTKYEQMNVTLDLNTQALTAVNQQLILLNYRMAQLEDATRNKPHAHTR